MSNTPRTDGFTDEELAITGRTFARLLERDLHKHKKDAARLRAELRQCKRDHKRADVV